jgi:hypothetical protein
MVLEEESGLATLAGARRQVDDSKGGQCALSLFGKLGYYWLINFLFFVAIREIFRILNGIDFSGWRYRPLKKERSWRMAKITKKEKKRTSK